MYEQNLEGSDTKKYFFWNYICAWSSAPNIRFLAVSLQAIYSFIHPYIIPVIISLVYIYLHNWASLSSL